MPTFGTLGRNVAAPCVACDPSNGNRAYLAYECEATSNPNVTDVFIHASDTRGTTFGPAVNVSASGASSRHPSIVIAGNTVTVYWEEMQAQSSSILAASSSDGGVSFSVPVQVATLQGASAAQLRAIHSAARNQTVVAWNDGGVLWSTWGDPVQGFSTPIALGAVSLSSNAFDFATDGTGVQVAYIDTTGSIDSSYLNEVGPTAPAEVLPPGASGPSLRLTAPGLDGGRGRLALAYGEGAPGEIKVLTGEPFPRLINLSRGCRSSRGSTATWSVQGDLRGAFRLHAGPAIEHAPGAFLLSGSRAPLPIPIGRCLLEIDLAGMVALPIQLDALGTLTLPIGGPLPPLLTAFGQAVYVDGFELVLSSAFELET
jgi:hypothetical protein